MKYTSAAYVSTRGGGRCLSFLDAALAGQAEDGGLLMPETLPDVSQVFESWRGLSYQALCHALMTLFIDDIPKDDLRSLIDRSYAGFDANGKDGPAPPVLAVGDYYVLELFHGPTLAFKDFGLQFLGNVFEYALTTRELPALNVLCATSGDTGSAAIEALKGKKNIQAFVMHPQGRPSRQQRLQMTTVLDDNVHNIAIDGSFDDCQSILKGIFSDLDFKKKYAMGAVNSINWARILAQIVYYFYAYFQVTKSAGERIVFSTPTGNFGNMLAAYLAARMGLPIAKLILATNDNDILSMFFNQGQYRRGTVHNTLSPAMDIQVASNLERYLFLYFSGDSEKLSNFMRQFNEKGAVYVNNGVAVDPLMASYSVSDQATLATIEDVWEKHQYRLDPHTAVGFSAARAVLAEGSAMPVVCLATAHPAKFPKSVPQTDAKQTFSHPILERLDKLPERCITLPADQQKVMHYIQEKLAEGSLVG